MPTARAHFDGSEVGGGRHIAHGINMVGWYGAGVVVVRMGLRFQQGEKDEGRGDRTPDRWVWNPAIYH